MGEKGRDTSSPPRSPKSPPPGKKRDWKGKEKASFSPLSRKKKEHPPTSAVGRTIEGESLKERGREGGLSQGVFPDLEKPELPFRMALLFLLTRGGEGNSEEYFSD